MKGLAGKVALVTGATGLIGSSISLRLAREGATVIVASRSAAKAERWVKEAPPSLRGQFVTSGFDLSDLASIRSALSTVVEQVGFPSILVANASLREGLGTSPEQVIHQHFGQLFQTDIAGHYLLAREIVERDDSRFPNGSMAIVWLSSIYAKIGVDHRIYPLGMLPTPVQYAAVKSAVSGTVTYLAGLWGCKGVRVNALVSGGVQALDRQPGDFAQTYAEKTMLGRMGTPDEIAAAVAFLASDEASYVTGTCLTVDGGFTSW